MKKVQLTKSQIRNLYQCQDDVELIHAEILRAQKAGVPIDPNLLPSLEDCRGRVNGMLEHYTEKGGREVV